MEKEIWKSVKGYENYSVSNYGRIKSLGNDRSRKEKVLKSRTNNKGYLLVNLFKNGKIKTFQVHRLVAQAFIPNPHNYPEVNHKTENPLRNFVYINEDGTVDFEKSELEWCTHEYNMNYGTRNKRVAEAHKGRIFSEDAKMKMSAAKKGKFNTKHSKPVLQLDKNTNEVIAGFPSTMEVKRQLGFSCGNISECCRGIRKTAYGYIWRYKNE